MTLELILSSLSVGISLISGISTGYLWIRHLYPVHKLMDTLPIPDMPDISVISTIPKILANPATSPISQIPASPSEQEDDEGHLCITWISGRMDHDPSQ